MEHVALPNQVYVGREICGTLSNAESREVLITNGIGGYGSLTLANTLTRSYHGLLIAALRPPLERTLLLSKVNETATYMGQSYPLFADRRVVRGTKSAVLNRSGQTTSQGLGSEACCEPKRLPSEGGFLRGIECHHEVVAPKGFKFLDSFHLLGTVPVFRYSFQDAVLEKMVWMKRNENTVYTTYHLNEASQPVLLQLDTLVNCRNHHERTFANETYFSHSLKLGPDSSSVIIRLIKDQVETTLCLSASRGRAELVNEWITNFVLCEERTRGYSEREDHLHAATFTVDLLPNQTVTFVASTNNERSKLNLDGQEELALHQAYETELIKTFQASRLPLLGKSVFRQTNSDDDEEIKSILTPSSSKDVKRADERCMESEVRQLLLAADQFIVSRGSGCSIMAGFHWFTDWTRDVC